MATFAELKALTGAIVRMQLSDGSRIQARIIDVQDNVRDQVAYELIGITNVPQNNTNLTSGSFYAASLDDIRTVSRG